MSAAEGTGDATLAITAKEIGEIAERIAAITIKVGDKTETIIVIQAMDAFSVMSSDVFKQCCKDKDVECLIEKTIRNYKYTDPNKYSGNNDMLVFLYS